MTIIEAINQIDNLKHNTYSQADKVSWLSRVDTMVKMLIINTHEGGDAPFTGYDQDTDPNTELLVPAPFDELYLRWMEMQIDYLNGEYEKYNNSAEMYNTAFDAYRNWYNRNHMPKGRAIKYF